MYGARARRLGIPAGALNPHDEGPHDLPLGPAELYAISRLELEGFCAWALRGYAESS